MYNFGVALIGAGFMGMAHTEGLRRLGIQPVGILDLTLERSEQAAKNLGIPKAYKDYDELLADDEVQVVHITSPNRLHFEHASRALKGGKHVLCEKPLAMTAKESGALVNLAKETGLVAGVNYNLRFYPLNLEARHKISQEALGNILSVQGSYMQDWLLYPTDYNWRLSSKEGGMLRAVADIGTHWLDLMHAITGLEVEAVLADLKIVYPTRLRPTGEVGTFSGKVEKTEATEPIEIDTEDMGALLLRFKNGTRGSLWVSQVAAGRKNCLRYEISGAKASLSWNSEQPNEMWLGYRDKANEILIRDPGLISPAARNHITYPGGHNEGYGDTLKQGFKAFYDYLTAGDLSATGSFATFADGHREVVLGEAILQSHQEERWVTVA